MGCCRYGVLTYVNFLFWWVSFFFFNLFLSQTCNNMSFLSNPHPGDTFPLGCRFDSSIVHHQVITRLIQILLLIIAKLNKVIWESDPFFFTNFSTLRKIQTTTIVLTTLNMESTQRNVDSTMSWCLGDMMIICIW